MPFNIRSNEEYLSLLISVRPPNPKLTVTQRVPLLLRLIHLYLHPPSPPFTPLHPPSPPFTPFQPLSPVTFGEDSTVSME